MVLFDADNQTPKPSAGSPTAAPSLRVPDFFDLGPDTEARLFLAIPIPPSADPAIARALEHYPQYIESTIPRERWHLTLVWLGNVLNHAQYLSRLLKPLPQTFVPTISLTYVGRGLQRTQLWAYANPSPMLMAIRTSLLDRLKAMRFQLPPSYRAAYVPHVHLADLFPMARGVGLADAPATTTFAVPAVHLYQSHRAGNSTRYSLEGTIELTSAL